LCESQSSFYPPPTCKAYTIAILLHDPCPMCDPLPDPLFVCHTPFNIGNGNIVSRPSTITPPTGISRGVFRVTILVPLAQLTHDQRTPAVSFEQVVGAAVPAAVCRWGLCPCCPGVGRCLSGVNNHSQQAAGMFRRTKGLSLGLTRCGTSGERVKG